MINIDSNRGKIFALRIYSGFLLAATVLGTLFFLASVKPVTFYYSIIIFLFLLLFCCAPSHMIFSKTGKVINYLFCIAILCRLIYEIYFPREFITLKMHIESQTPVILAAILWWILIRKVIANNAELPKSER